MSWIIRRIIRQSQGSVISDDRCTACPPRDTVLVEDFARRRKRAIGKLGDLAQGAASFLLCPHKGLDLGLDSWAWPRSICADKLAQRPELRTRRIGHGRQLRRAYVR